MAHEEHERRTKYRQEAGGSSSSRGPSAQPKTLAKCWRPNTLREESSPRGVTPESPEEYECLKIRPPVAHTNWEVVNYNKVDPRNLITLWDRPCYCSAKERGTDERFWTFFHQDWYHSVLYRKTTLVVKHQSVHIDYMKCKKDMHFNRILEACEFHGIIDLLLFRYNWNQEIIAEFYTTLFFDKKERIFMWMTNGRRFHIKLTQFAKILGLSAHLDIPKKLHTGRVMTPRKMTPMYIPNSDFRAPQVDGILPHFLVLHRMGRMTLAPRIGDPNAIPAYEQNLLDALMKHERFDVFDYIVDEI
jgi:hypothetical protein